MGARIMPLQQVARWGTDYAGWVDYKCDDCGLTGRIEGYRREGAPEDSVDCAEVEHFLDTGCKGTLRATRLLPSLPEPPKCRTVWE